MPLFEIAQETVAGEYTVRIVELKCSCAGKYGRYDVAVYHAAQLDVGCASYRFDTLTEAQAKMAALAADCDAGVDPSLAPPHIPSPPRPPENYND